MSNVQNNLENLIKYSVKINSNIIHDLLHDYLNSSYDQMFKIPKNKVHTATSYQRLLNLLVKERFKNRLILLENETHYLFCKINYNELMQKHK